MIPKVSNTIILIFQVINRSLLLIDNQRIMSTAAIFNRLPGAGAATNKAKFAKIFKRMKRHFEHDFNFVPMTFDLSREKDTCKRYMAANKHKTFIVKPHGGAEGYGIFLVQNFK